jgi:hypothetical protein
MKASTTWSFGIIATLDRDALARREGNKRTVTVELDAIGSGIAVAVLGAIMS